MADKRQSLFAYFTPVSKQKRSNDTCAMLYQLCYEATFISAVHMWFISYIINTHFFHGIIWTHNWPAPNVSGFIAQMVEHRTGIARSRVQTPLSPEFFSGFFTQLHKLRSLRLSFLQLHFISAVYIWFISYIINIHFFHGIIWTHNWPPNVSGFIAQLGEHRTGIARSRVQTPFKSWIFFRLLYAIA